MIKQTQTVTIMLLLLAAYVCALSLWPPYADLRLSQSISLNPSRVILAILISCFFVSLAQSQSYRTRAFQAFRRHKFLIWLITLYCAIRILSGLIYGARPTFLALHEVASTMLLMIVAMASVRHLRDTRIIFFCMVACLLIVGIYAVLEYCVGGNFLVQFADPTTKMGSTAIFDKTRDGTYRAQSVFEHPLSLAQFLVIIVPIAYVFFRNKKWFLLASLSIAVAVVAAVLTGTRTALIAPMLAAAILGCISMYGRYKEGRLRIIHVLAIAALLGFVLIWVPRMILGTTGQQSGSTSTRIAQIHNGLLAAKDRPLIGYGPGNAASVVVTVGETEADSALMYGGSLDNLFLTKMVESGIPSVLLFILIMGYVFGSSARQFLCAPDLKAKRMAAAIVLSVVSGIASMAILSIFTVLPLFFVVMGIGLARPASPNAFR